MEVKEWTPNDYYSFEDLNRIEYNTYLFGILLKEAYQLDNYLVGNYNMIDKLGGKEYDLNKIYFSDKPFVSIVYLAPLQGKKMLKFISSSTTFMRLTTLYNLETSTTYTYSFIIYSPSDKVIGCANYDGENKLFYGRKSYSIKKGYNRICHTFTTGDNTVSDIFHIVDLSMDVDYYFGDFKLEKGNKATEWTPQNIYEITERVIQTDMNRDTKSIEFADSLNRVESNMKYLKGLFVTPPYWEEPKTDWKADDTFSYIDANRLEKNIGSLYSLLKGTIDNYNYCGTYTCGEGVRI